LSPIAPSDQADRAPIVPGMAQRDANEDLDAEPPPRRARDLTRPRAVKRRLPDSGRRHHLGATPATMPVFEPDGPAGPTRTGNVQLTAATVTGLERLHAAIIAEMTAASSALDFEGAARLRDEAAAAHAEIARRIAAARGR
jgi:hypothetical protein